MKSISKHVGVSQKVLALAIVAAFVPAHAEESADVARLSKPASSVSVGLAGVSGDSKDRSIFGQYNGMREHTGYGLFDIDLIKRDDATGTWMTLQGRNLGLDNRELGVSYEEQGNWKVMGGYNEITHHEMRTINTADSGVGSATPTVTRLATPGTGADVNLSLKRKSFTIGAEKWFSPSLLFEVTFKTEDKDGSRFWAKGYDCAAYVCALPAGRTTANTVKNALLMVAEPVDTTTKQIDAKFSFNDEKLNLTAGYYGSFFTNGYGNVQATVPNALNNGNGTAANPLYGATAATVIAGGGMSLQNVLQLPMALAPDNQAHQIYFDGNYAFTPKVKATFKYAYTHATQNDDFLSSGLTGAPAGVSNLGGVVDTTLAQFGMTAKPIAKLSLVANVRYERKEDKTPNALYNVEAQTVNPAGSQGTYTSTILNQTGVASGTWNNNHVSVTKLTGKFEASYVLPANVRATVGIDRNEITRPVPTSMAEENVAGLAALREKTQETGYRAELRSAITETLNGAFSYATSKRTGSDWTSLSTLNPATPGISAANLALINAYCGGRACYGQQLSDRYIQALSGAANGPAAGAAAFPMSLADLDRHKWKLSADWSPTEALSLQFSYEDGKDSNTSMIGAAAGGRGFRDTGLKFYNVDATYMLSDDWKLTGYAARGDQTLYVVSSGNMAALKNQNDAFGLGVIGKPSGKLEVGANLAYLSDVNKYGIQATPTVTGAAATAANIAQAAVGVPDVTYKQTTLSLFGKYAIDKQSNVRVDLVHQRAKLKEWAWGNNGVPFVYADNTTVNLQEDQRVTYLGARYIYTWR